MILVGSPGAGKTSFVLRHLIPLGYERVNQDILKSRDKCVKVASEHLKRKQSVAIGRVLCLNPIRIIFVSYTTLNPLDNTNADVDTRAIWVALAKSYSVPIRCIHLTASSDLCQHNDAARALGGSIVCYAYSIPYQFCRCIYSNTVSTVKRKLK